MQWISSCHIPRSSPEAVSEVAKEDTLHHGQRRPSQPPKHTPLPQHQDEGSCPSRKYHVPNTMPIKVNLLQTTTLHPTVMHLSTAMAVRILCQWVLHFCSNFCHPSHHIWIIFGGWTTNFLHQGIEHGHWFVTMNIAKPPLMPNMLSLGIFHLISCNFFNFNCECSDLEALKAKLLNWRADYRCQNMVFTAYGIVHSEAHQMRLSVSTLKIFNLQSPIIESAIFNPICHLQFPNPTTLFLVAQTTCMLQHILERISIVIMLAVGKFRSP